MDGGSLPRGDLAKRPGLPASLSPADRARGTAGLTGSPLGSWSGRGSQRGRDQERCRRVLGGDAPNEGGAGGCSGGCPGGCSTGVDLAGRVWRVSITGPPLVSL